MGIPFLLRRDILKCLDSSAIFYSDTDIEYLFQNVRYPFANAVERDVLSREIVIKNSAVIIKDVRK